MRPISDTIARLSRMQMPQGSIQSVPDRLADLPGVARNPGALRARIYVPADLAPGAALVVALHGCTQTAAGYDHGTGWSALADREGFAVLFPEQQRSNNANLCFNWFESADIARTGGEAESIAAMIDAAIAAHGIDPARVFVTGLSAGGAMAAVMLATWPDKLAGGAIIGGLPYGGATGVPQALDRMRGAGAPGDAAAAATARAAGAGATGRPRVSVWHGTADTTVVVANLDRLIGQWRGVHGLPDAPTATRSGTGWEHRSWDADGVTLVEEWRIAGMGHGVPIDPGATDGVGAAGPFMLDVGLSSTHAIAASWGLTGEAASTPRAEPAAAAATTTTEPTLAPRPARRLEPVVETVPTETPGVQQTIERALRAAGLMR
ncbi:extracellular catalytic domain type 1 short-chain-length polyhydroxyalkanoate depolymerase [Sphingomonas sp. CFBP 13720]|uniref:extracellular catalytic domain type 1 short-chain-length polyhydroxyalkanoate depolymerase n=1 Tax=Sphingomonas sp. CFBP 13720 TaxID=2775302 RepID=UPI0017871974|nr:PHB depolymerase family esterase [Sphingomonas sp. CFBP 13720]MBD8678193.1 PHB depolymerase family esterase [Sphingomonas sp. CFBP 13720]